MSYNLKYYWPPHRHVEPAREISAASALEHVQDYLERSLHHPYLHPDCRFIPGKLIYNTPYSTGGLELSRLRLVEAGLRGERVKPTATEDLDWLENFGVDESTNVEEAAANSGDKEEVQDDDPNAEPDVKEMRRRIIQKQDTSNNAGISVGQVSRQASDSSDSSDDSPSPSKRTIEETDPESSPNQAARKRAKKNERQLIKESYRETPMSNPALPSPELDPEPDPGPTIYEPKGYLNRRFAPLPKDSATPTRSILKRRSNPDSLLESSNISDVTSPPQSYATPTSPRPESKTKSKPKTKAKGNAKAKEKEHENEKDQSQDSATSSKAKSKLKAEKNITDQRQNSPPSQSTSITTPAASQEQQQPTWINLTTPNTTATAKKKASPSIAKQVYERGLAKAREWKPPVDITPADKNSLSNQTSRPITNGASKFKTYDPYPTKEKDHSTKFNNVLGRKDSTAALAAGDAEEERRSRQAEEKKKKTTKEHNTQQANREEVEVQASLDVNGNTETGATFKSQGADLQDSMERIPESPPTVKKGEKANGVPLVGGTSKPGTDISEKSQSPPKTKKGDKSKQKTPANGATFINSTLTDTASTKTPTNGATFVNDTLAQKPSTKTPKEVKPPSAAKKSDKVDTKFVVNGALTSRPGTETLEERKAREKRLEEHRERLKMFSSFSAKK